jgi:general secretion pathway protein N
MNVGRPRPVRIVALTLTLVSGAIAFTWMISAEDEAPAAVPPAASLPTAPKMPSRELGSEFREISQRPLFSRSRLPAPPKLPEPAPASTPAQHEPAPTFSVTLAGVLISPDRRSAVVRLASGKTTTVAEGETVDGWKLERVAPDLALFRYRAATVELSFPVHQASVRGTNTAAPLNLPALRRR